MLNDNHWRVPDYRQRITTKEWKKILLHDSDQIIFRGNPVPLKAKNLGYGVVEVSKDLSGA